MFGIDWIQAKWADITNLPERLERIMERAHELLANSSRSYAERQAAGRVWADARQDLFEVRRLLRDHLRESASTGLGIGPLILVVGGITAVAAATALIAIFGRADAYERELDLIASGAATPDEIKQLRSGAPVSGGFAGGLHELGGVLKWGVLAALAYVGYREWQRAR